MELLTSTDPACYRKQVLLPCELHGVSFSRKIRKPLPNWLHGRALKQQVPLVAYSTKPTATACAVLTIT